MADLKPGWKRVKLGEVAINSTLATKDHEQDGFVRYILGKHIPEDGGRITRWNPVGDGEFGSRIRTIVRAGDVICTTRGPKLRVAVAEFECLSAHTNFILRPQDPAVFLPTVLEAVVRSDGFQDHLRRHFRGSTNLFVNWSDAARYEFALPPLEEQRRLALLLQAIDRTRTQVAQLASNVRALRLAALHDLYTPKAGWMVAALGERYEVQLGKKLSHETGSEYEPLPYLRNANVQWNELWLDDVAKMPFNLKERQKYRLRHGDILACEGRHVGKAAMWRAELDEAYYQMSLHRLRPREPATDAPTFMLYYLEYCSVTGLLAAATGATTIPHLSAERFAAIRLAFPSLDAQERIARKIVELDAGLRSAERQVVQTRRLLNQALQMTLVAA